MRSLRRWLLVLALVLGTAGPAIGKERVLRLGLFIPATHVHVREALIPWIEQVNPLIEPEGYTIQLFSGGVLGRNALLQSRLLTSGVIELTWFVPGYTPGLYPNVTLFELPLLHDDPVLLTRAFWRTYERGMLPDLDGMQALALSVSPAYQAHLTFPVDSLDDLAGRKIRIVDASEAQMVRAMGGTPVAGIGATELAEALSRNLVDGALFSWHAMGSLGVDRVTHVHIDHPLTFTPSIVAMNKRVFDSLPSAVRTALLDTSGEALSLAYTESMLRGAVSARARAGEEAHRQFYVPTAADRDRIDAAIEAMRQRWHQGNEERLALIRAMEEVLAELEAEEQGIVSGGSARR
jgi:TRAP-type C4-dicarboxylate transport system substrate-binding protein